MSDFYVGRYSRRNAGRPCDRNFSHLYGNSRNPCRNPDTVISVFRKHKDHGKANQAINVDKYNLLVSLRHIKNASLSKNTIFIVAVMCILLIAILYWFFGTELGCSLRATGCNPNMSRAQGINTNMNKVLGLMISNGLVGLSSALLAQYQGFADVNMGRGSIVIGLAAVDHIGEAIFGRIFRNFALRLLAVIFGSIPIIIWYFRLLSGWVSTLTC